MTYAFRISIIVFIIVMVPDMHCYGQSMVRPGLLRAQMTLSPSLNLASGDAYFYLHGSLEGYVSSRLSFSGEGYYFLGDLSKSAPVFDYNHSAFFGASWHFAKEMHDPYLGFQPGVSFTRLTGHEETIGKSSVAVNPLASVVAGYNFYLNGVFHFFIQTRLVMGQHNTDRKESLTDVRLSAGLGFQFPSRSKQ